MEEPSPSRHRRRERRRRRAAQGAPTAAVEPTPADGTPAAADITVGTAAAAQDATGETAAAAQDATGETAAGQASATAAAGQASAETAAVPAPGPKRKSRARRTDAERSLRGIVGAGSSQVGVVGAMRARDAARPTAEDLAAAERDVVIVRRRYVPPDALPGAR
jgi:hypothetical protein